MKKFPIGFWNYTTGQLRAKDVADWADLGMTMANSPEINDSTDKDVIRGILDACVDRDIKVIMCDQRCYYKEFSDDPDAYRERFQRTYEDYGHHPAVFGFLVGDEPEKEKDYQNAVNACLIQQEVAPELTPFLNFLPYTDISAKTMLNMSFDEWAKKIIADAKLKIFSYDRYSQLNPGENGIESYFRSLRVFREAADAAGISPWTTLLSVGHFRYRCPNEDDLRWQLNTAVVSGMEGIMWYFVYERVCRVNYRTPPIDAFGERTETFDWLARTNKYFLHQFGDFFMRAKRLKTFHYGKAYGGYELWKVGKKDDILLDITSPNGIPAVVSYYELDGKRYVAIVNNSFTENGLIQIHVPKTAKGIRQWDWDGELSPVHPLFFKEEDDRYIGGDWHCPGQMKLYCVEN